MSMKVEITGVFSVPLLSWLHAFGDERTCGFARHRPAEMG